MPPLAEATITVKPDTEAFDEWMARVSALIGGIKAAIDEYLAAQSRTAKDQS